MRILYLILSALVFNFSAEAQPSSDTLNKANSAAISFNEMQHDFGDIHQGDVVEYVFAFENTGNSPLILNNVLTTCGCTAPKWPKDPIKPGEQGEIKVVFDSTGKMGRQNKIITVRSNAEDSDHRLKINVMVLPSKK